MATALGASAAVANPLGETLYEPPVFQSHNGVLDLLMIAESKSITSFDMEGPWPTGWVYTICPRPKVGRSCPADATTASAYGGARLALKPGDTLKVRLVNKLPPVPGASLARIWDDPLLALNPTNFHTHGLVVSATANTSVPPAIPVYGDFVFTSVFNPANGNPARVDRTAYDKLHMHGDVVASGVVDYKIKITANHPPGAYWFHPHMHGNSLVQLQAGLSGIISVGDVAAYACADETCSYPVAESSVRHLIIKDMQVLGDHTLNIQPDPGFCAGQNADGPFEKGFCNGDPETYPGGKWFVTVNGQQYPSIPVQSTEGEIWRLTNASNSASYKMQFVDDKTGRPMAVQVVSMDGVSVSYPTGATAGQVIEVGRNRIRLARCGAATVPRTTARWYGGFRQPYRSAPVCATEIDMMPAARVEIHAAYRNADNRLSGAPAGQTVTLRNIGLNTGPAGDSWPLVDLATISFPEGAPSVVTEAIHIRSADAAWTFGPGGIFTAPVPGAVATPLPDGCARLAAGHKRRIYFANPNVADGTDYGTDAHDNAIFGLGYEEIDENGVPVPDTFIDIGRFDPGKQLCVVLDPGQRPVDEVWELYNLSTELHNFHIHQTKFRRIDPTAPVNTGNPLYRRAPQPGIAEDTVPLPWATPGAGSQPVLHPTAASCTVDDFKWGRCAVTPVTVKIPFARLGTFVFHCHILEHEDGGMMAAMRVVSAPD